MSLASLNFSDCALNLVISARVCARVWPVSTGDALNISVPSSQVGDLVQVTHEGLAGAMVLMSAHVGTYSPPNSV